MPAKSQSQREYLNAKFGHAWVKAHGFDNPGKLPAHVKKKKRKGSLHQLMSKEAGLERTLVKGRAEAALEQRISALTGKSYKGRR